MKVKQLKKLLEKVDDDRIVILQNDSEGNGFSPLSDIDYKNVVYKAESTWSGEIGLEKLTPTLIKAGYTKDDLSTGEKALILIPVN
jgi:glucose dehydrogenase